MPDPIILETKGKGDGEKVLGSIKVPTSMHNRFYALAQASGYKVPELRRMAYQHYLDTVSIKKEDTPK